MPGLRYAAVATAVLVGTTALAGPTRAASFSPQFSLTGDIATPGTYDYSTLSALPPTTQTVTYTSAGQPVTDTYTGTNLWTVLNSPSAGGGITPIPGVKNSTLDNYVVAVGSDGYEAVFSGGELNPKFGNQPNMIAYQDTSGPLVSNGFARAVVPGDTAGGRYVSNIVELNVGQAPALPGTGGGKSSQLTLNGVKNPGTLDLAALQALPATTVTATYTSGSTPVTDTYTGVSLWTLLNSAGLIEDPTIKNDVLRQYVVAVGSDGYEAVFSLGEIDPAFGDQPDLVAYADTGGQLGPDGVDGFARMVVPGDIAGGRYISNLVSLSVFTASVPEPASGLLFATPLLALLLTRGRDWLRASH
jgi:DMSO/TMAO reductase YedYZ molybdopterin-dependent catalytic subunit